MTDGISSEWTPLTIDCDWAVVPTPLPGENTGPEKSGEPDVTYEHLRYPYAGRPDGALHRMCRTPAGSRACGR